MDRNRTKLDAFLKANGIRPSLLIHGAGVSRQHVYRLRNGSTEPTRHMMIMLATAAGRILRRKVEVSEMFDLDEELGIVTLATIEQGRAFADSFIERARQSEVPDEAFSAAHVMTWSDANPEAQVRFHAVMDDILGRFWTGIREPVARAFVRAANEVLARGRHR